MSIRRFEKYSDYLESPHWLSFRSSARLQFGRCVVTGNPVFDLHHLNYRRLGREVIWLDVIPLATDLHHEFHEFCQKTGTRFYEIAKWLDSTGRRVTAKDWERLKKAEKYNRKLMAKPDDEWEPEKKSGKNWIAVWVRPMPKKKRDKENRKRKKKGLLPLGRRRAKWRDKTWVKASDL